MYILKDIKISQNDSDFGPLNAYRRIVVQRWAYPSAVTWI